jgi:hypothetical protein
VVRVRRGHVGAVDHRHRHLRQAHRALFERHAPRPGRRARADTAKGWTGHALDGMGAWKWPGVAAVVVVLALLPATAMQ